MSRYERSTEMLARARRVTPTGTQTRSKAATMGVEGAFPAFLRRGFGATVEDVDGNEYVDWSMSLAAVGLGHAYPAVTDAVRRQAFDGPSLSLAHPLEYEVAELLCAVVPCAESVRFIKSGSEATEAAMRIARVFTGRDLVVSVGYHGWHSVHDAAKREHPGVPAGHCTAIRDVAYNDLGAVEELMLRHDLLGRFGGYPGAVAAVLVEPVLHELPEPGYLVGLRELCDRYGALLIFDEVVAGFRWAVAGAQEYFGIRPDLATFGKALANGYPLACVLGRRDVMEVGAPYVSSTHGGDAVALAAAKATIDAYLLQGFSDGNRMRSVIQQIWHAGERFIDGVNAIERLPVRVEGYPCKPRLVVKDEALRRGAGARAFDEAAERREVMSLVLQEAARRGVLLHPSSLCVSFSHHDLEVERSVSALRCAADAIAAGVTLEGPPYRSLFERDPSARKEA